MKLIEIFIACLVAVFFTASLFLAFYSGRAVHQKGAAVLDSCRAGRAALDFMGTKISSMVIAPPDASSGGMGLYYGDCGEFKFHALLAGHSGDWDLCRVGFRLNEEKNEIQRLFNVNPHLSPADSWQPLVSGVTGLDFFFYSGIEGETVEFSSWDTFSRAGLQAGRLPDAVKVVIRVLDDKEFFEERAYSVKIPIPAGGERVFMPRSAKE